MSLRVLLADESASIRKVFQMGLQDFGADVKSVHNGLDVVEVAESYQPHIIFADILLQKKNGYEVSNEIQAHQNLKNVPIVLMWSSFMELDQKKYASSGAKGELEKPFDIEVMRNLIKELVEMTKTQQISQFLEFPESIKNEFVEEEEEGHTKSFVAPPVSEAPEFDLEEPSDPGVDQNLSETAVYTPPENTSIFNLQSEDAGFDMAELERVATREKNQEASLDISEGEAWTAQPLSNQSIEPVTQTKPDQDLDQFQSMNLQVDANKLNLEDFLYQPDPGMTPPPQPEIEHTHSPLNHEQQNPEIKPQSPSEKISAQETEFIIRQETRSLLKEAIAKQLPQILEKVVREELNKVLEQELALQASHKN